jgi:hypothetical protein
MRVSAGSSLEVSMDYLVEAKKFIQQARHSHSPEVLRTDLEMAEWFLSRAIEERDDASGQAPHIRRTDERVVQGKQTA